MRTLSDLQPVTYETIRAGVVTEAKLIAGTFTENDILVGVIKWSKIELVDGVWCLRPEEKHEEHVVSGGLDLRVDELPPIHMVGELGDGPEEVDRLDGDASGDGPED